MAMLTVFWKSGRLVQTSLKQKALISILLESTLLFKRFLNPYKFILGYIYKVINKVKEA